MLNAQPVLNRILEVEWLSDCCNSQCVADVVCNCISHQSWSQIGRGCAALLSC